MSDQTQSLSLFLDLLPNQPKSEQTREEFRLMLRKRFENRLTESADRIWELPPIILQKPFDGFLLLLQEARELFVAGHFYSCVAMSGIVGERLVKDALRAAVFVEKEGQRVRPPDIAFDQLEHIEVSGITRFLREAGLLGIEVAKAADTLGQLRNRYAHARGKDPHSDAIEAIKLLHVLVEGTVSVFKDYTIKDGAFVRRAGLHKTNS